MVLPPGATSRIPDSGSSASAWAGLRNERIGEAPSGTCERMDREGRGQRLAGLAGRAMERRGAAAQREPHPEAGLTVDTTSGHAHDLGQELPRETEPRLLKKRQELSSLLPIIALPRPTLFPVALNLKPLKQRLSQCSSRTSSSSIAGELAGNADSPSHTRSSESDTRRERGTTICFNKAVKRSDKPLI